MSWQGSIAMDVLLLVFCVFKYIELRRRPIAGDTYRPIEQMAKSLSTSTWPMTVSMTCSPTPFHSFVRSDLWSDWDWLGYFTPLSKETHA